MNLVECTSGLGWVFYGFVAGVVFRCVLEYLEKHFRKRREKFKEEG